MTEYEKKISRQTNFLDSLQVGDEVLSDFIIKERNVVRKVVEIRRDKKGNYRLRADAGRVCPHCGMQGTPLNGLYDQGVDGVHFSPANSNHSVMPGLIAYYQLEDRLQLLTMEIADLLKQARCCEEGEFKQILMRANKCIGKIMG